MGKALAILGGLIAMAGGVVLAIFVWRPEFVILVKGCIPPILFLGGLIALIAGISSIKDAARTKKLEEEAEEEVKVEEPVAAEPTAEPPAEEPQEEEPEEEKPE